MAKRVQELEDKFHLLDALKTTLSADEGRDLFTERETASVSEAWTRTKKEWEEKRIDFRKKFLIYEQSVQTTQSLLDRRTSLLDQVFSEARGGFDAWVHSDVMDLFVPRQEELMTKLRESEESVIR